MYHDLRTLAVLDMYTGHPYFHLFLYQKKSVCSFNDVYGGKVGYTDMQKQNCTTFFAHWPSLLL